MHELSIVESMMALVFDSAKNANAERIVSINLVVGELSGVVQESVEFYFGFLSKDTIAAGAKLNFKHIPTKLECRACGSVFSSAGHGYVCPDCGDKQVDIIAGRELYIESLEVQ